MFCLFHYIGGCSEDKAHVRVCPACASKSRDPSTAVGDDMSLPVVIKSMLESDSSWEELVFICERVCRRRKLPGGRRILLPTTSHHGRPLPIMDLYPEAERPVFLRPSSYRIAWSFSSSTTTGSISPQRASVVLPRKSAIMYP